MERTFFIRKFRLRINLFWSTFQEIPFREKISVRGDKINLPFTFHPKFSEFFGKWQTTGISRRIALLAASYF